MDKALFLKFTQHMDLYEELLSTGDAELVEVSIIIQRERTFIDNKMPRTLTKTRSGVVERMAKVAMSLGRRW